MTARAPRTRQQDATSATEMPRSVPPRPGTPGMLALCDKWHGLPLGRLPSVYVGASRRLLTRHRVRFERFETIGPGRLAAHGALCRRASPMGHGLVLLGPLATLRRHG